MADYTLNGMKWGSQPFGSGGIVIRWSFGHYGETPFADEHAITESGYRALVRQAFDAWEAVADIDLVEVESSANTDISVSWAGIDGHGKAVGTTYYAYNGTRMTDAAVYMDTAERWTDSGVYTAGKTNFYSVVLHEIGHTLGLGHVEDEESIMNPYTTATVELDDGDIAGIQALYGAKPSGGSQPVTAPSASLVQAGTAGDDRFVSTAANETFYGGAGSDSVAFAGARAGFAVGVATDGAVTVEGAGSDRLFSIEKLIFDDGTLSFEGSGHAGQGFRLYQAAFDRTPDAQGLAFQVERLEHGTALTDVAAGFAASPEFAALYGSGADAEAIVERFYLNVLDRAGEAEGIAYHVARLEAGASVGDVLAGFSESPENVQATAPAIHDGIWLLG